MCSIIHPVPSLLHVVLINSLGARVLMACAIGVTRELECNRERFAENGFDSCVFHCLAQNVVLDTHTHLLKTFLSLKVRSELTGGL